MKIRYLILPCVIMSCTSPSAPVVSSNHEINVIAQRYNCISGIDTLDFKFTCQYTGILLKNNRVLFSDHVVTDVTMKDSFCIVDLATKGYPTIFASLVMDTPYYNMMKGREEDFAIMAKIGTFEKVKIKLDSDYILDSDKVETNLETGNPDDFYCTGKVIGIYDTRDKKEVISWRSDTIMPLRVKL